MDVKESFQTHGIIEGSQTLCSVIDRQTAVGWRQFFNFDHVSSSTPKNNTPPHCPFILGEVRKVEPPCESEELAAPKV